jgi:hypothetical protein
MVEKAEALVRDNPFLEFRLDYLSKPGLALPRIKRFMESHPGTVVIATCRRVASGGKFRGSIASQLDILGKAAASGCQLVDVELQTASKCKPDHLQKLRTRAALILSFHDFRATKKLDETLEKMLPLPGRLLQSRQHGHYALRQRHHDQVSGARRRPPLLDRHVHGRAGHHQPRAGRARRQRLHFRFRHCRRRNRTRPGHRAGTAQRLSHRSCRRSHARLRSRRRSHRRTRSPRPS